MILVEYSVWIDFLRGTPSAQTDKLDSLPGSAPLAIGDLILTEVLQGCSTEREFNQVQRTPGTLTRITLGGPEVAVLAAKNFRRLRAHGITVRKTIDTVIATRCILDGFELLHSDREFDPFQEHPGLRCVPCEA